MKIIIVAPFFAGGGIERVLQHHITYLISHGHDIHLVLETRSTKEFTLPKDVDVTYSGTIFDNIDQALVKLVTKHNFNIAIVPHYLTFSDRYFQYIDFMYSHHIPIIAMKHTNVFFPIIVGKTLDTAEYVKKYNSKCHAVTLLSDFDHNFYKLFGLRNGVVLRNPIPPINSYQSKRKNIILTASRLLPNKMIDHTIIAFKRVVEKHPDWQLVICGDGREKDRLIFLARKLGIKKNVIFTGEVDVTEWYKKASIFSLSSCSEGMPMVILESQMHGIPSIMYNLPNVPLVEHMKNGILVPFLDTDLFAKELCNLIENPHLRKRLGKAAFQSVYKYRSDVMSPIFEALLFKCTKAPLNPSEITIPASYPKIMVEEINQSIRAHNLLEKQSKEIDLSEHMYQKGLLYSYREGIKYSIFQLIKSIAWRVPKVFRLFDKLYNYKK